MNKQLSEQFFKDIGQDTMSTIDKQNFTLGFISELDTRVNLRLMDKMNEEQLNRLNQLIEVGDAKNIYEYQKSQFPELDRITDEEFEALKQEIIDTNGDLEEVTTPINQPEPAPATKNKGL